MLRKHNIQSVLVPPCCTNRLKPLDISVNKAAKSFLTFEFQNWYADQVTQQYNATIHDEEVEPIDLSASRMKCLGGQWLVRLFEYLSESSAISTNGFRTAHIPQSIDASKPVFEDEDLVMPDENSIDDEVISDNEVHVISDDEASNDSNGTEAE